jgi:hypothetical protein
MNDHALWLEGGLLLLAGGLLMGLVILLFGRASGGVHRGRRHGLPAAPVGAVPQHPHQHTESNAAR